MTSQVRAPSARGAVSGRPEQAPLIELAGVEKVYRMGKVDYRALRGVDLSIAEGELVAVPPPRDHDRS